MVEYIQFDKDLCDRVSLSFVNGEGRNDYVEFQFPPKFSTDSRKGNWKEGEIQGDEPIAVYQTSGPREITMAFTYIVDGNKWTTEKVAQQIRLIRGYFARTRSIKGGTRNLVAVLDMWYLGGSPVPGGSNSAGPMTCRLKGVDVKHSETIVAPPGSPEKAYHLRSDITLDLRIWTKGGASTEVLQNLKTLRPTESPQWY